MRSINNDWPFNAQLDNGIHLQPCGTRQFNGSRLLAVKYLMYLKLYTTLTYVSMYYVYMYVHMYKPERKSILGARHHQVYSS